MNGLHLIADLHDCQCPEGILHGASALESFCVDACQRHGLTVVGRLFHAFCNRIGEPAGVTGTTSPYSPACAGSSPPTSIRASNPNGIRRTAARGCA